jgi:hypothetical protein
VPQNRDYSEHLAFADTVGLEGRCLTCEIDSVAVFDLLEVGQWLRGERNDIMARPLAATPGDGTTASLASPYPVVSARPHNLRQVRPEAQDISANRSKLKQADKQELARTSTSDTSVSRGLQPGLRLVLPP